VLKKLGTILTVATIALLPAGQASAAGKPEQEPMVTRGIVFARADVAQSPRTATPDGASAEYRSTKPNKEELLKQYLESPKAAQHVVDASELLDEVTRNAQRASASTPNPVSVTDCRNKLGYPSDGPKYWYQDRFNACAVTPVSIQSKTCDSSGNCRVIGTIDFRLTLVGHGSDRVSPDGSRSMVFQFFSDQGRPTGVSPPPDWDSAYIGLRCVTYVQIPCKISPLHQMINLGILRTTSWSGPEMVMRDSSISGTRDNIVYYDLGFRVAAGPTEVNSPVQVLRCDTAPYVNRGGCVFMDVESWIKFNLRDARMSEAVQHISDAFTDITKTKPGIFGTEVMGSRKAGFKLHRLSEIYEQQRYNRNNYIAVQECKKWWGDDYATSDPKGPRECDEYPFRSTFEGAAYNEYEGSPSGKWSYSVRVISGSQNNAAGSALGLFYRADHIIHADGFWVDVVDEPVAGR
jgi:hypothetical protein